MTRSSQERVVREWEASGKPVQEWCKSKGIKYGNFARWRRQKKEREGHNSAIAQVTGTAQATMNAGIPEVKWAKIGAKEPNSLGHQCTDEEKQASRNTAMIKIARNGWTIAVMPGVDERHLEKVMKAVKSCC